MTTRTTIFGFLAFYLSHRGDGPEAARAVVDQLHWLRAQGHSRESVNRAYYRTYAGERRDLLENLGRQWFAYESGSGDFFVPEVKSEIDGYRRVGIPIVLVSGSFFACLNPLADAWARGWPILAARPPVSAVTPRSRRTGR
ncbi:hypothetical protein Snas_2525 [Stackebrandtia nassauensis DSM 44728]|uniref:Uncharacterized protein n=1 Tax=Stackebrandtia nassauensis (strain DSM 44728 / CIP 108903 / NRRL B-16338 / NBRC 102104 / LLR-40K-21) TaxID=446470 RepID=D3Q631_STANL|nr:hypothetical protein Snas_2525 [Stackebrandtia nassauensis DSM 44728]